MTEPFVYTTYIQTTPQQLWRALTEPEFTKAYWNTAFTTDWRPGSPMTWDNQGVTIEHPQQRVLEADPYQRLSYTWHAFTPEWAAASNVPDADVERLRGEPVSKVSFDLHPEGDSVRLTVTHDDFGPDSLLATMISGGWPKVLSALKTTVERSAAAVA